MRNAASATTAVVASSARGLTVLWASTRWAWTYGRNGRQSARTNAPGMSRPIEPAGSGGGAPGAGKGAGCADQRGSGATSSAANSVAMVQAAKARWTAGGLNQAMAASEGQRGTRAP